MCMNMLLINYLVCNAAWFNLKRAKISNENSIHANLFQICMGVSAILWPHELVFVKLTELLAIYMHIYMHVT